MEQSINQDVAVQQLMNGYENAEKTLNDLDELERLLQRAEQKLKSIPGVGDILATLPIFISLVNSYVKKEYTDIPIGTIIAIISAITYVVAPVDLIPDFIPWAGHLDDAAVVAACVGLVKSDVDEYCEWREKQGKTI